MGFLVGILVTLGLLALLAGSTWLGMRADRRRSSDQTPIPYTLTDKAKRMYADADGAGAAS